MKKYAISIAFALLFCSFVVPDKITLWLCGDSTMSVKAPTAFPETGWGMPFVYFWESTIQVKNFAKNGRSTKTFISEKIWQNVIDSVKSGDYVFIQFGHNDEVEEKKDRYTTPEEFKSNLLKFVNETKQKKGIPILLTPVSRRKFDSLGNAENTHFVYSNLVREIAKSENVFCIDLDQKSKELFQAFGEEKSKLLFLQLKKNEHPNYPNGKIDNTHFNELGARMIAEIVLAEVVKLNTNLNNHIVN
jgi:lysophospholipase L1-like esterase